MTIYTADMLAVVHKATWDRCVPLYPQLCLNCIKIIESEYQNMISCLNTGYYTLFIRFNGVMLILIIPSAFPLLPYYYSLGKICILTSTGRIIVGG